MARTISEIKSSITSAFVSNSYIQMWYALDNSLSFEDQFSIVSFESVFFEVLSMIVWTLENIFDLHKKEVTDLILNQKVPNARWYRNEALRFQYGFKLDPNSYVGAFLPYYEDNGVQIIATEDQIQASKIIKYASVTRNITNTGVKISMKIAGENMDDIITDEKALSFTQYIEEIQAAGDNIVVVNYLPDVLFLQFKVCYDPLLLLADGRSILTGKFPVQDAINQFLKNLDFDGELSVQKLEAAILDVEGVKDLQNLQVSSKWIVPGVGYGPLQPIEISRIAKSGRFTIKNDITGEEDWSGMTYINYQAEP